MNEQGESNFSKVSPFVDEDLDESLFPVRCYTCGKILGPLKDEYFLLLGKVPEISKGEIFRLLGVNRICCRNSLTSLPVMPSGSKYWSRGEVIKEFAKYSEKGNLGSTDAPKKSVINFIDFGIQKGRKKVEPTVPIIPVKGILEEEDKKRVERIKESSKRIYKAI